MLDFSPEERRRAVALYEKAFRDRYAHLMNRNVEQDADAMDVDSEFDARVQTPAEDESATFSLGLLPLLLLIVLIVQRYIQTSPMLVRSADLQGADKRRGSSLKWWNENESRFPFTAALAREKLTAQATEADVERNFSHARHILDTLRASMSDDLFHKILFLYENRALWTDVDPALIFGQ